MMNGPFSRNYSQQHPSHSFRTLPVQQKSSPKVISVPVHFVSSDQPRTTVSTLKDSAAVKIQKVFRGFAVRKSVKKIDSIRNEVSEIERRIDDTETVDLIRNNAKERLRVNETLMSLLFKLDSIRGVDCGIRDLRKAVTRKAIALQEKVDSIAQIHHQTLGSPVVHDDSGEAQIDVDDNNNVCISTSDEIVDNHADLEAVEEDEDCSDVKEVVKEDVKKCDGDDVIGEVEAMETSPAVNSTVSGEKDVQKQKEGNCVKYDKGNREILENLVDDNLKMMKLMNQITERNEMQVRMINALSRRVEQLEKALDSRKKKKTQVSLRRRRDKDCISI